MKKFHREKSERRKGVYSDIPREEKREVVLCEEKGMSNEEKSENERKEKREDHESKKEKHNSEVEREKQESLSEILVGKYALKSLGELNPKVVDTISPIEKVYVDENDKGKNNYFGSVQDKAHIKNFNKAIVDLTQMRKGKRGDVISLLHRTSMVFSNNEEEVHDYEYFNAYVNSSYKEELVSGMIEDALIYHKSV
ncbi:hypothetical protein KY284_010802 [Solanum tuberosum]|nr:hypothetical protein KY284_010802 [Solanum tuberosum]